MQNHPINPPCDNDVIKTPVLTTFFFFFFSGRWRGVLTTIWHKLSYKLSMLFEILSLVVA